MPFQNKAAFLDRDGTIIKDVGYLSTVNGIEILAGADSAIRLLSQHNFRIIIVSNQSGVGKLLFPIQTVLDIHHRIKALFYQRGAIIDAFYFCPHDSVLSDTKPAQACKCRKPRPGMIWQAAKDYGIDLSRSYMIGDKVTDVLCGVNAGVK